MILLIGSIGFLLTGLSSFFGSNFFFPIASENILFFPQGLVMCFYGMIAFFLSFYLWLVIIWDVGEGYNEFDKNTGIIKLFRWGFPGENRRIQMIYFLKDIEGVKMELKEGINPKRALYLKIRGQKEIPLTQVGQPLTLEEMEQKAANLASFLQVPIESL